MNIIDFLSFAPFYVELVISLATDQVPDLSTLIVLRCSRFLSKPILTYRCLRMVRTLRIFKIGRISRELPITVVALKRSRRGFLLLAIIISIVMVIASTALFYAEQTESHFTNGTWIYADGLRSDFQVLLVITDYCLAHVSQSRKHSGGMSLRLLVLVQDLLICEVLLTVSGYGDTYPRTPLGKTVASATMLCGVVILSFPYAILSYNFTSTWNAYHARRKIRKIAPLRYNSPNAC